MQEKKYNVIPTRRRILGYVTRFYRDGVSGGDAGFTIVKHGLVLLIAAGVVVGVIAGFGVPILIAAAIAVPIYIVSGLIDEHERNEIESKKIIELEELNSELNTLEKELNEKLNINLQKLTNEQLLTLTLYNYLRSLELLEKDGIEFTKTLKNKEKNGGLPNKESMLRLIETMSGIKRDDNMFAGKLKKFLSLPTSKIVGLNEDKSFGNKLIAALGYSNGPDEDKPLVNDFTPVPTYATPVKAKTLKDRVFRFIKNALSFVHRSSTGGWLVFGGAILLGAIIPGSVVGWPILVGGLLVAVLSGAATIIYQRYVDRSYESNKKAIAEETGKAQARYQLLCKLNKFQGKTYANSLEQDQSYELHSEDYQLRNGIPLNLEKKKASGFTRARAKIATVANTLYGMSVGTLIGIGIAGMIILLAHAVVPLLIPASLLVVTLAGAAVGALYAGRMGYMMGKKARRGGEKEIEQEVAVAHSCEQMEKRLKNLGIKDQDLLKNQLAKSKQQLVLELLESFIKYRPNNVPSLGVFRAEKITHEILDKKEKILLKIEAATGIRRSRLENGLPNNADKQFYDQLALFLHEDKQITKNYSNLVVGQFQTLVLGKNLVDGQYPASDCSVNKPQNPGINFKSGLRKVNSFASKYALPLIVIAGAAISLGGGLFGPALVIPLVATAAVVLTMFTIMKFCEWRADKNKKRLTEIEEKLPLVEAIETTNLKKSKLELLNNDDSVSKVKNEELQSSKNNRVQSRRSGDKKPESTVYSQPFKRVNASKPKIILTDECNPRPGEFQSPLEQKAY